MVVAAPALSPARVWWSAVRPATLAASVAPVLAGTAIAIHEGGARFGGGLAALVVAVGIQLGVNFANDFSDHVRGADVRRVGPVRAASSGVVRPEQVRWAAIGAFGVAGLVGLALSVAVDLRLLVIGAACILAAWLYTGGPRPYGYFGLGEVFVFVFFGLVATLGTVYVETGMVKATGVLVGCAMGCLATAILVLNNLRDIDTDVAAGKRTLATRIGRGPTRWLLVALACVAFAIPIVLVATKLAGAAVMLVYLAVPIAALPLRPAVAAPTAPRLVGAPPRMAVAQLAYALLFTLGLLL